MPLLRSFSPEARVANFISPRRMDLSSDTHRGLLSWLHQSNNLIFDQAWTNKQEGPHCTFNQQGKGHPAGSGPKSERAPHHDKITPSLSLLLYPSPSMTRFLKCFLISQTLHTLQITPKPLITVCASCMKFYHPFVHLNFLCFVIVLSLCDQYWYLFHLLFSLWVGVEGFSKVVAAINQMGGSSNLLWPPPGMIE